MKRLKYILDRKSLEIIYKKSFVRPTLEYADIVWDNCFEYEKDDLQKIQNEAARIVTGCTKLVSISTLNKEVNWQSLQDRRNQHKLITFYKMTRSYAPEYLSSLIPPTVGSMSHYQSLRNACNIQGIYSRTANYANSFLPSTIQAWNQLPDEIKSCESINMFKSYFKRHVPKSNPLFYYGERKYQVLHTQLRTMCSALNHHLYMKNIKNSPHCHCGAVEDNKHFFFECPTYNDARAVLLNTIANIATPTIDIILSGDSSLNCAQNSIIFQAVHRFIKMTKRFS